MCKKGCALNGIVGRFAVGMMAIAFTIAVVASLAIGGLHGPLDPDVATAGIVLVAAGGLAVVAGMRAVVKRAVFIA